MPRAASLSRIWGTAAAAEPFLHPGRSAAVEFGGVAAGWIGEVHPLVCRAWDLDSAVAFEIDLAPLLTAATAGDESYEDFTTFPAVYQDLAVVVPAELAAMELRETILAAGGELLRTADLAAIDLVCVGLQVRGLAANDVAVDLVEVIRHRRADEEVIERLNVRRHRIEAHTAALLLLRRVDRVGDQLYGCLLLARTAAAIAATAGRQQRATRSRGARARKHATTADSTLENAIPVVATHVSSSLQTRSWLKV